MSGLTHTRGPWEVRASRGTVDFGIIVRDERSKDGWAVIAEVFSEIRYAGERAPEALGNARLMAGAPDLLAQLRIAKEFIAGFHGDDVQEGIDEMLAAISAAIAKATGSAA